MWKQMHLNRRTHLNSRVYSNSIIVDESQLNAMTKLDNWFNATESVLIQRVLCCLTVKYSVVIWAVVKKECTKVGQVICIMEEISQLQSKPNPWFYLPCHVSRISIKSSKIKNNVIVEIGNIKKQNYNWGTLIKLKGQLE